MTFLNYIFFSEISLLFLDRKLSENLLKFVVICLVLKVKIIEVFFCAFKCFSNTFFSAVVVIDFSELAGGQDTLGSIAQAAQLRAKNLCQ